MAHRQGLKAPLIFRQGAYIAITPGMIGPGPQTRVQANTIPVPDNVANLDSGAIENEFPNGDDLAISRATDFYSLDELVTDQERELRDRVRQWCDTEVAPAAAGYWEG